MFANLSPNRHSKAEKYLSFQRWRRGTTEYRLPDPQRRPSACIGLLSPLRTQKVKRGGGDMSSRGISGRQKVDEYMLGRETGKGSCSPEPATEH